MGEGAGGTIRVVIVCSFVVYIYSVFAYRLVICTVYCFIIIVVHIFVYFFFDCIVLNYKKHY